MPYRGSHSHYRAIGRELERAIPRTKGQPTMRGYGQYFSQAERIDKALTTFEQTDNRPQVIAGPNTAPTKADAAAIVAFVAHQVLQNEVDWSFADLVEKYPTLQGITREQVEDIIREALA